jgi:hypothetical protein
MFTKIHYAFYNVLFEFCGKLAERYSRKLKEGKGNRRRLERKLRRCIDDRDDILDIMFTMKGLN